MIRNLFPAEGGRKNLKVDISASEMKDECGVVAAAIAHSGSTPLEFSIHDGQRILCLDGGGLKGLILIEVLIQIEKLTQKKITELFDWIVGTSTGGVIALGLVYGMFVYGVMYCSVGIFSIKNNSYFHKKYR